RAVAARGGRARQNRTRRVGARTPRVEISTAPGGAPPATPNAPKAGGCRPRNRHTWLGFATAANRIPLPAAPSGPAPRAGQGRRSHRAVAEGLIRRTISVPARSG